MLEKSKRRKRIPVISPTVEPEEGSNPSSPPLQGRRQTYADEDGEDGFSGDDASSPTPVPGSRQTGSSLSAGKGMLPHGVTSFELTCSYSQHCCHWHKIQT